VEIEEMQFSDWEALRAKYLAALFQNVPVPKSEVYLHTPLAFSQRPYAVFAFRLWQGMTVRQLAKSMRESIQDEVDHDGAEVMNMIGILGTCLKHSRLLKDLASEMPKRLKDALKAVRSEYEWLPSDPEKAFKRVFSLD